MQLFHVHVCIIMCVHMYMYAYTVEPRLADTPQRRTPAVQWTILNVRIVFP